MNMGDIVMSNIRIHRAYTGNEHINVPLSDISFMHRNQDSVAEFVFPARHVEKKSDKFRKIDKRHFEQVVGAGPIGSEVPARRATFGLSEDEYAMHIDRLYNLVADEDRENTDTPLDLDVLAVETITENLRVNKEIAAQALVATAPAANKETVSTKWNAATAGNPLIDLEKAAQKVRAATGQMPNAILFGANAFAQGFINNEYVVDRFKHVREGAADTNAVARYFSWVDEGNVAIGRMIKITGVGAGTTADIWGDSVFIFRRDMQQVNNPMVESQTMSYGKNFRFAQDSVVTTGRDANPPSDVHHIRMAYGFKILDADCGYLLEDTNS